MLPRCAQAAPAIPADDNKRREPFSIFGNLFGGWKSKPYISRIEALVAQGRRTLSSRVLPTVVKEQV